MALYLRLYLSIDGDPETVESIAAVISAYRDGDTVTLEWVAQEFGWEEHQRIVAELKRFNSLICPLPPAELTILSEPRIHLEDGRGCVEIVFKCAQIPTTEIEALSVALPMLKFFCNVRILDTSSERIILHSTATCRGDIWKRLDEPGES